jgi:hypothetical protein
MKQIRGLESLVRQQENDEPLADSGVTYEDHLICLSLSCRLLGVPSYFEQIIATWGQAHDFQSTGEGQIVEELGAFRTPT